MKSNTDLSGYFRWCMPFNILTEISIDHENGLLLQLIDKCGTFYNSYDKNNDFCTIDIIGNIKEAIKPSKCIYSYLPLNVIQLLSKVDQNICWPYNGSTNKTIFYPYKNVSY